MARARIIKPGFFQNEDLSDASPEARLLGIGLLTLADREGRLEDRPKRIKAQLAPYDDCDIESLLKELQAAKFIVRYQFGGDHPGGGGNFIEILNFVKHQNPHHKEADSVIPPPMDHLRESARLSQEINLESTMNQARTKLASSLPQASIKVKGNKQQASGLSNQEGETEEGSGEELSMVGDGSEDDESIPESSLQKAKTPRYSAAFEAFWVLRKWGGSKSEAWTSWSTLRLDRDTDLRDQVFNAVRDEIAIRSARETAGAWTENWKHACRWLRHRMWENPPAWPEEGAVIPIQRTQTSTRPAKRSIADVGQSWIEKRRAAGMPQGV